MDRLTTHAADSIGISSITLAELQYGVAKSGTPAANRIHLAEFLTPFGLVPFGGSAAAAYGRLRAELESAGTPVGPLDMLIAAHALALGVILVTNNVREFGRVRGLSVESWLR